MAEHLARDVQRLKLGEMATRARAARLLTLDAAAAFDRGERCDLEAGMAKYFASEAALENSIESMRRKALVGNAQQVAARLTELAQRLELEELVIVTWTHDPAARHRSYELLAEAFADESPSQKVR